MNHKKEKATHRQDKSLSHVSTLKPSITFIFTQFQLKTGSLNRSVALRLGVCV